MAPFTVSLQGDRELIAKMGAMPDRLQQALTNKVRFLAQALQRKVQLEHLSGPTGPHTLSVGQNTDGHTGGQLKGSVFNKVESSPSGVIGKVGFGADVVYAAIHEYGGTINIPEIVPVKAKVLHFIIDGKDVFATRVRSHSVVMPERAPLRTSLEEMTPEIVSGLQEAVMQELKKP